MKIPDQLFLRFSFLLFLLFGLPGCERFKSQQAVFSAVSKGEIAAVEKYLDEGGSVNVKDDPGMTLLHWAVNEDFKGSHREMVRFLLERGAKVDARDDIQTTPLHLVSNKETAELLIKAGADVNAKDSDGETILYSSARNAANASVTWEMYSGLVGLLISKGADVNAKVNSGEAPLHIVARQFDEEKSIKVCQMLIEGGAKVNEKDSKGKSPLDHAIAEKRVKTADFLRKQGGSVMLGD